MSLVVIYTPREETTGCLLKYIVRIKVPLLMVSSVGSVSETQRPPVVEAEIVMGMVKTGVLTEAVVGLIGKQDLAGKPKAARTAGIDQVKGGPGKRIIVDKAVRFQDEEMSDDIFGQPLEFNKSVGWPEDVRKMKLKKCEIMHGARRKRGRLVL